MRALTSPAPGVQLVAALERLPVGLQQLQALVALAQLLSHPLELGTEPRQRLPLGMAADQKSPNLLALLFALGQVRLAGR